MDSATNEQLTRNDIERGFDGLFRSTYRFVRSRVPSPQEAEDLASETLFLAWKRAGQFRRGDGELGAWLCGIAKNQLRMHWRKRRVPLEEWEEVELVASDNGKTLRDAGTQIDLAYAFDGLSETDRCLLLLRHVDGLSYADIAGRIQVTEQAARKRVSRILRALTERFTKSPTL